MADYYSLIMDCINYVQNKVQGKDGTSKIQLNRHQCEYVAQELLKLLQSLQSMGVENLDLHHIHRIVFLYLHATMKRAQMSVERCCCKNSSWLATAVALGDTQEDFIAIRLDLHQWSFMLDIVLIASAGASQSSQLQLLETGEKGYQRLLKLQSKMRNAIEAAARLDQEELLERIAWSREDDYIRRVYLKSQLNHTEGELQNVEGLKTYTISRDLGSGASGMVLQVNWLG